MLVRLRFTLGLTFCLFATSAAVGDEPANQPENQPAAADEAIAETKSQSADAEPADEVAPVEAESESPEPPSLLGEFSGTLDDETVLAIQIRPVGAGDFDGLAFKGGLPGAGAEPESSSRLVGHRAGSGMVLSGTEYAIFVSEDSCRVLSIEGTLLGTLDRIQRSSPSLGAAPPEDAVILFDGSGTDQFTTASMTDEGLLKEGANINPLIQDFDLHVEFRLPLMADQDSQQRGNSGLYLHSRYECQVLDSFATVPMFNGCGSIYRFKAPDVNMCLPPQVWQTYDIRFTAARWGADGKKIRNARITSWLNGVVVQNDVELLNKTGHGAEEGATLLPTKIQDHNNPVRFRNIWIIDRGIALGENFPPTAANPES